MMVQLTGCSFEQNAMKTVYTILGQRSGEDISCARVFKVLADETRLAVVEQLLDGPKTVSEINQSLSVEPTLLSHHLKTLRDAQIVTATRTGRFVSYSLAPSVIRDCNGRAIELGCCQLSFP